MLNLPTALGQKMHEAKPAVCQQRPLQNPHVLAQSSYAMIGPGSNARANTERWSLEYCAALFEAI